MGLVLLDITFRLEKAFFIKVPDNWYEQLGIRKAGDDVTLAEFHRYIVNLCHQQQVNPPANSWSVFVKVIADGSGMNERDLRPTTWLVKDVAPDG